MHAKPLAATAQRASASASLRPRRGLASLALVALVVLPGCLGTAAAGTAEAERAPAEQAAKRWDPNAQLVGVFGIEGTFGGSAMMAAFEGWSDSGSEWQRPSHDTRVGDGIAEFWVYGFLAQGKSGVHLVIVDRNGTVLKERDLGVAAVTQALGAWKVNSDQALTIAKGANQGLKAGVEGEHWGLVEFLQRKAEWDHPHWQVMGGGGGSSGGGGGLVEIDAVTGAVLQNRGGFGTAPGYPG